MNELPEVPIVFPAEKNPSNPFVGVFDKAYQLDDIVVLEFT